MVKVIQVCLCYASSSEKKGDQFEGKGIRSVFIRYPCAQKGYKLYDLENKRIFVNRDVVFKENIFPFLTKLAKEAKLKVLMNEILLIDIDETTPRVHFEEESEGETAQQEMDLVEGIETEEGRNLDEQPEIETKHVVEHEVRRPRR